MKTVKCSSCGADVSRHDQACSYCGASNLGYQPPTDEVNALLEKAMDAFQQAHYAVAIDNYNQAIALDPDVFNAYFYLASSLNTLGRTKEAIQAMQRAQALRPGSSAAYTNLGILYKQQGENAQARKYLEKALKMVDSDGYINNREQVRKHIKKELSGLKRWGLF